MPVSFQPICSVMAGTRKFNEADVLKSALALFWKKGYTATTMLDLAEATGVQRGSLYNAYQNKDTLFLKALCHHSETFLAQVARELEHDNAGQAFKQVFGNMVERVTDDNNAYGCFSTRTIMEASGQCPDVAEQLKTFLDGLENLFTQRLQQAKNDKQFSGEPESYARYLVTLTRGIAVIERIYHDKKRLTETYQTAMQQMPFNTE